MKVLCFGWLILFNFFSSPTLAESRAQERPLQVESQMVPMEISPEQGAELRLKLKLPDGYRAYAEQFRLELMGDSGFKLGAFRIEPLQEFFDEVSHKKKKGVIREALLTAPLEAPLKFENEHSPLKLRLTYQACTKTYCLFPIKMEVPVEFQRAKFNLERSDESFSVQTLLQKPFDQVLSQNSLWLTFLLIFIAGILTSFTPCIFPMIPITLAVLGRSAHVRSKRQTILVAHVYVLGIALSYSVLGVFAASTGALFGSFMNSPWVLGLVCLVFLSMSLSMFGLYDIQAPGWIQDRLSHAHFEGYRGIFLAGTVAGLVASPCVGPVLVGILTYVAQTKNLWIGFWSLFIFAFGMGQLFLVLGIFSSATKLLPKSGAWMDGVKHFFGLLMLFAFYSYLQLLIPARWFDASLGLGAILLGSLKGAFEKDLTSTWKKVRKGLCQALILVGGALIAVSVLDLKSQLISKPQDISPTAMAWQTYSDEALKKSLQEGRPVILDFYADWCAACLELEHKTFAHPDFLKIAHRFTLLRVNATEDSDELSTLKEKYGIVGLPTVVFYDSKGKWRQELTLTAFEEVEPFLKRVEGL